MSHLDLEHFKLSTASVLKQTKVADHDTVRIIGQDIENKDLELSITAGTFIHLMTDQGESYFRANIWEKEVFKDKVDKKALYVDTVIDRCQELEQDDLAQELIELRDDVI